MPMIVCPDPTCRAPARIVDRWTWGSTSGPVEHVQTRCERGHWFTPTVDLPDPRPAPTAAEPSPIPVLADYHGATTWSDAGSTFVQVNQLDGEPDAACGDAPRQYQSDGWCLTSNP
jgi:hypothetical protein